MQAGEWILFEFEIVQIKEMRDGRVVSVSDGTFETSGFNLSDRCYPLTLANKNAAAYVKTFAARLHRDGGPGLNFPDLHQKAVELADGILRLPEEKDVRAPAYDAVSRFYQKLFEAIRRAHDVEIDGVRVFGRTRL